MMPLVIGAIGVVFGDIGTSPLYTMRQVFGTSYGLSLTTDNVLGLLSLVFWALIIIVTFKYVDLMMRADNRGDGGQLALPALIAHGLGRNDRLRRRLIARGVGRTVRLRWWLIGFGIVGASMFCGDAMITPAISVLSAVEGIAIITPALGDYIIPVTVAIMVALFAIQKHGTASVGKL